MVHLLKTKNKFMEFYQRREVLVSMFVFACGFLVDIYTIRRIDNLRGLIQQGLYLIVLGTLLTFEIRKSCGLPVPQRLKKFWKYHNLVVHFLFGSLLSLYTIFYYTSASALTSFLFIVLLAGLMLTNEFGKIRAVGLPVRVILFSICTLSYFSFIWPIILGKIGPTPFWLGFASSLSVITLIGLLNVRAIKLLLPGILMHVLFLGGYFSALIPPVPVAVKRINVYYDVEKKGKTYIGKHTREFWDNWKLGPKEFYVRPGDKVTVFLSIFSPTRFQDQIFLKWYYDYENLGWRLEDTIPINIVGGRKEGFRGYGSKQFYKPGLWRVLVETSDGREVGRISVNIVPDTTTGDRDFKVDKL